jgi:hypothetical protein
MTGAAIRVVWVHEEARNRANQLAQTLTFGPTCAMMRERRKAVRRKELEPA